MKILQIIQGNAKWLKNFGSRITVVRSLVPGFGAAVCQAYFFTAHFFSGLATRFQVRDPGWDPQTVRIWWKLFFLQLLIYRVISVDSSACGLVYVLVLQFDILST